MPSIQCETNIHLEHCTQANRYCVPLECIIHASEPVFVIKCLTHKSESIIIYCISNDHYSNHQWGWISWRSGNDTFHFRSKTIEAVSSSIRIFHSIWFFHRNSGSKFPQYLTHKLSGCIALTRSSVLLLFALEWLVHTIGTSIKGYKS